jgi:hypothetical protein
MSWRLPQIYALALLVYAARCLLFAALAPFPSPFDEHAHLSYVLHILATGDLVPAFEDLRLIELPGLNGFSDRPNYLNHPSPFYVAMAGLAWPLADWPPAMILALRLVNASLSVAAVAVLLRIGLQLQLSLPAGIVYAALVVATPTLAVVGGVISNDNLAILGGALCCAGALGLLQGRRDGATWACLATGFAFASLAKLTAGLLCGALVLATLVWVIARDGAAPLAARPARLAFILCFAAILPYVALWADYGSPAPFTPGQADMIERRLDEYAGWRDLRLDLPQYLAHFGWSMLYGWRPSPPQNRMEIWLLVLPALLILLAVLGVGAAGLAAARRCLDPTAAFVLASAAALAIVLVIHIDFAFRLHQETGWPRGIYPRYYFPLLAAVPAASALLVQRAASARAGGWVAGVLVAVLLIYDMLHSARGLV